MAEANTVEEVAEDIVPLKTMIEYGSYTIFVKRKGKNEVWKVLREVKKPDGININNVVACKLCKNVLKFIGKKAKILLRHKCYIKIIEAEENQISLIKVDEQSRNFNCMHELDDSRLPLSIYVRQYVALLKANNN